MTTQLQLRRQGAGMSQSELAKEQLFDEHLYMNTDTGETFTYDELAEIWRQFGHEMSYKCFEDFIESAVEEVR